MQVHQFNHSATNQKQNRVSEKIMEQKMFWILKIAVIVSIPLFGWYLLLTNAISTKGFLLAQAKQEQAKLQLDIEKLDIDLTIPVSLYALESTEQVQDMEYIKKYNYVEIKNSEVAFAD